MPGPFELLIILTIVGIPVALLFVVIAALRKK